MRTTQLAVAALLAPLPLLSAQPGSSATAYSAPLGAAAAPAAPGPSAQDRKAPKGYHCNFQMGFKFRQPKRWENIALKVDEEWMGANYISEKAYTYHDKDIGVTFNHNPEFKVIVFPHEAMKRKKVETDEDGETITWTFSNPYKSYDDFVERTFQGGGFYLLTSEEDEIGGVKVTKVRYAVEKGAQQGPQYIDAYIYHAEDADYAAQLIGLQNHWDAIEKDTKQLRASFELIERDGPLKNSGLVSGGLTISRLDLSKGEPKERRSKAVDSEKVKHEKAIATLPERDWKHFKDDRILVLHSCDDRWAERLSRHTNGLLDWLDENFGYLGPDAYMRKPVVRVCKDRDEAARYSAGIASGSGGGYFDMEDEILTFWDSAGWTGGGVDWYNRNVFRYWLSEKNFALSSSLPEWIREGISQLVETARLDTRKPDWRYDTNVMGLKNAIYYGETTPLKDLFLMTSEDFQERAKTQRDANTSAWLEGSMLINYLASPEIRRHKLAKGLLETYLRNMMTVVDEIEKEEKRELDRLRSKVNNQEDEKNYQKARADLFKKMEKELLQRTFDMTFGKFDEGDWKALTAHFHESY